MSGADVHDARLVEAVDVVVHVAGAEPEYGVAGGGEERAGVVHAEVAARMAEDDRGLPSSAARWRPEQPPDERTVRRDEPDGLARDLDPGIVLGQRPIAQTDGTFAAEVDVE